MLFFLPVSSGKVGVKSEEANNPYYYYTAVRQGLEVTEAVGLRARPTAPLPGTRQRKPWRELLTVAGMGGGGRARLWLWLKMFVAGFIIISLFNSSVLLIVGNSC